ncbi:739_t:CDS:2, partial [Ambispora leptoticha]
MPKIDKTQKKNKTKKTLSLPTPSKPKKTKNPSAYYECMASQSQTGLKPSLTKCCQNCKVNSQALLSKKQQARTKELKKITAAYQQIGISLGKLLRDKRPQPKPKKEPPLIQDNCLEDAQNCQYFQFFDSKEKKLLTN